MPILPGTFPPRVQSLKKAARLAIFTAALLLVSVNSRGLLAAQSITADTSEIELTNFAFANYLGSGLYSSGDKKLFILRLPLTSDLIEGSTEKAGLVLRYPIALGVGLLDDEELPEIGDLVDFNNFVTLSVVPGLEYVMPVNDIWTLSSFVDLGLARDFTNDIGIAIGGIGAKSYVSLEFESSRLLIANRLLYAEQENLDSKISSHFASFETGLEYKFPMRLAPEGPPLDFSIYFINYYYLEDLVLGDSVENRISLQNKNEAGFTLALPRHEWLPEDSRLGFGVQATRDADFYRIVFGSPFF